jgi:2,5-diketo-D-gluconate reductase A
LDAGYRHIDTAAGYFNEREVGHAIEKSGLPRGDVFVTTKLWNADQGYDSTLAAFDASMDRLGVEYLDLYLIHWPMPAKNAFVDTFKAFAHLRDQGRISSIGVSNFEPEHLRILVDGTGIVPAVNQIELHPYLLNEEVRSYGESQGIATEAWSPIAQGGVLDDPVITEIASAVGRTPAQVVLRWHIQRDSIVFPKSNTPERIEENFALFDFELDDDAMSQISGLDRGEDGRTGPHPDTFDRA